MRPPATDIQDNYNTSMLAKSSCEVIAGEAVDAVVSRHVLETASKKDDEHGARLQR
jgi:hypothetical protein